MTREELIRILSGEFYEDFAAEVSRQVCDAGGMDILYTLLSSGAESLPRREKHLVLFRGAYVLERIYFSERALFGPFAESFCVDFSKCVDPSARRHFGKIMAHLLTQYVPSVSVLDEIAAAAAEWAVDPKAKVAVKIGAVEVLKCCRERVGWVADVWPDILGAMEHDLTPGIECRMRKSWK